MLFLAPKWWPTMSSRGVWPSGRPDSKESGACVPLGKVASFFVPWRLPKLPRQSVVHDDARVIRPSVGNTGGTTDDSVATIGPNRPTVGSRPWTFPAKERAVALTAQYFRRRLRHDRPQHRHTNRWQHTLASTTEEVQQGETESTKQNYPFTCHFSR